MIRSNGYLIGWQYYLKTVSRQCSNSSYVTIYRKGSDNRYAEVASTQLQPVQPNKNGINFQFVQKTLIAVKVGDVIGTYTLGCDSIYLYGRNIVSAGFGGGKANRPAVAFRPGYTFTGFDKTNSLSLKAYTTGIGNSLIMHGKS